MYPPSYLSTIVYQRTVCFSYSFDLSRNSFAYYNSVYLFTTAAHSGQAAHAHARLKRRDTRRHCGDVGGGGAAEEDEAVGGEGEGEGEGKEVVVVVGWGGWGVVYKDFEQYILSLLFLCIE